MILIGTGSNLHGRWGDPIQTINKAIDAVSQAGFLVKKRSRLIVSEPLGAGQGDVYVNGVFSIETHMPPQALLARLHDIELDAGRVRLRRWGARVLDLDLLAWNDVVIAPLHYTQSHGRIPLTLPHPGLAVRPFVLEPLHEIAPFWHHPVTGLTPSQMLRALPGKPPGRILSLAKTSVKA